jgi:hypothetical protein
MKNMLESPSNDNERGKNSNVVRKDSKKPQRGQYEEMGQWLEHKVEIHLEEIIDNVIL